MLDKFRCEQIVLFCGAFLVPNNVIMVTEYASCGSLVDCIRTRAEHDETVMLKLKILDAACVLDYLNKNRILHGTSSRTMSLSLRSATGRQREANRLWEQEKHQRADDKHDVHQGDRVADVHGTGGAEQEVQ